MEKAYQNIINAVDKHRDLMLDAVSTDIAGGGAGGLGEDPVAGAPEVGINQTAGAGFSPDAVDVDDVAERFQRTIIGPFFPEKAAKISSCQQQNQNEHDFLLLRKSLKALPPSGRRASG